MEPTEHKIKLNDRDDTIGTEFIYARVLGIMASFLCNLFDVGKGTCSQIIKNMGACLVQRTEATCFLAGLYFYNQDASITACSQISISALYLGLHRSIH